MRPLVSVVTPTWQRPELLMETIRHIQLQDYPNIEQIVIVDGPDDENESFWPRSFRGEGRDDCPWRGERPPSPLIATMLGRNWSGLMPASFGIAPLTVGYLMARGEYVLPWCDDERALTPSHITRLVDLLESSGSDFVYPKVRIWRNGDPDGPETAVIGTDPPRHGQITHMLARTSCFWRFGFPRWGSHPVDWSLVDDWMKAGATWAMLPDVTFAHRLDQI